MSKIFIFTKMPPHETIRDLGGINACSIAPFYGGGGIIVPTDTGGGDTFAVLNAAQTFTNKTLTTPIIASLKASSTGGTITMPTVASDSSATLATTADISSATTNVITTNGEQTLTNKTLTTPIIASLKQSSSGGTINMPEVEAGETATLVTTEDLPTNYVTTNSSQHITGLKIITNPNLRDSSTSYNLTVPTLTANDVIATVAGEQTLTNKTLTTPVIASLKQSSSGGTITMPTVASGESATLATTDDIPTLPTNLVSTDGTQTITGIKTLTSPIIASLKQSISGGTINMPTVASGETATLATALDIASLRSSLASATDFNTLKSIMTNLLSYLRDWIQVGNLTMNDVVAESDPTDYLGLGTVVSNDTL